MSRLIEGPTRSNAKVYPDDDTKSLMAPPPPGRPLESKGHKEIDGCYIRKMEQIDKEHALSPLNRAQRAEENYPILVRWTLRKIRNWELDSLEMLRDGLNKLIDEVR